MKTQKTTRPIATLKTVSPAMLEKVRAHETALENFEKTRDRLRAALIPAEGRPYRKPAPAPAIPAHVDNYTIARLVHNSIGTLYTSPASYLIKKEKPAPRLLSPAQVASIIEAERAAAERAARAAVQDAQREKAARRIDQEYDRFEKGQKKRRAAQAEREKTAAAAAEKIRAALNTEDQKTARRAAMAEKQPIFEVLDFETVKAAFTNKGTEVLNVALIAGASALKYALQKFPSDTLRAAYYSLVSYGISKTALQPDNSDACDVLQAAAVGIIESAAAAGIPAEKYAAGVDKEGAPLEGKGKQKKRDENGKIMLNENGGFIWEEVSIFGEKVPRRAAIHAANKHIHKLKNRTSVQSFEHFSNGNDFDDPQKDKKLIDKQAEFEKDFADCITSMKEVLKREELKICILVYRGYTQKEIAASMGIEQYKVSRMLAKARKKLYEAGVFTAHSAPAIKK